MSNIAMSIRSQWRDPSPTSPDDGLGGSLRGGAPSAVTERIPESSSPNVNNKSHIYSWTVCVSLKKFLQSSWTATMLALIVWFAVALGASAALFQLS
jgi:hypothetical protein